MTVGDDLEPLGHIFMPFSIILMLGVSVLGSGIGTPTSRWRLKNMHGFETMMKVLKPSCQYRYLGWVSVLGLVSGKWVCNEYRPRVPTLKGQYQYPQYRYPRWSTDTPLCFLQPENSNSQAEYQYSRDRFELCIKPTNWYQRLVSIEGLIFESKDPLPKVHRSRKWQDLKKVILSRVLRSSKEKPNSNGGMP
ncbi:hypothetical protein V6N12_042478 [Hibiscus sabdariffa]|uniref:Uncharacterized protein n=1 Tax=Hibiscus sabdariffa TaxID=183260 RepID=A0ABR2EH69_9ROSI